MTYEIGYEEEHGLKGNKRGTALVKVHKTGKVQVRRRKVVDDIAANMKELVEKARAAHEAGDLEAVRKFLHSAYFQAGLFCATLADQDGSPRFATKSLAIYFHEALVRTVNPAGVSPIGDDGLRLKPMAGYHAVIDALQWLLRFAGRTVKAGEIRDGFVAWIRELFRAGVLGIHIVFDKRKLVPPTKARVQESRVGELAYGTVIEAAAQLRTAIDEDSLIPMPVVMSAREVRAGVVEWLASELVKTVDVNPRQLLVVDTEDTLAAKPSTFNLERVANKLGEADGAMFAHIADEPNAVIASADADTFCWGLLTLVKKADPATGELPSGSWLVLFATNEGTRRTVSLHDLWQALVRQHNAAVRMLLKRCRGHQLGLTSRPMRLGEHAGRTDGSSTRNGSRTCRASGLGRSASCRTLWPSLRLGTTTRSAWSWQHPGSLPSCSCGHFTSAPSPGSRTAVSASTSRTSTVSSLQSLRCPKTFQTTSSWSFSSGARRTWPVLTSNFRLPSSPSLCAAARTRTAPYPTSLRPTTSSGASVPLWTTTRRCCTTNGSFCPSAGSPSTVGACGLRTTATSRPTSRTGGATTALCPSSAPSSPRHGPR